MTSLLDWFRKRPIATDVLLSFMVLSIEFAQALTITASQINDDVIEPSIALHWIVLVIAPAALIFRRTRPILALSVGTVGTMAAWMLDLPVSGLAGMILIYSVVLYAPRSLGLRAAVASGTFLCSFTTLGAVLGEAPVYVVPLVAWTVVMPILVALNINSGKALLAVSDRRLADTEERRIAERAIIIQDERNRVARELHDVVAHGLSLIVIQAGAGTRILERATQDTSQEAHTKVTEVMKNIDGAARQSLGEMRQILGILRDEEDGIDQSPWRPTPGAVTITELVAQAADGGLDVDFETMGEPHPLPTAVGAATYRIVQEALTNVRKHGGPNVKASVVGVFGDHELTITIDDDGRGAAALAPALDGDGHGLIGMRERTELLGGTFTAGPRVGGGFRVRVSFPTENPSDSSQIIRTRTEA